MLEFALAPFAIKDIQAVLDRFPEVMSASMNENGTAIDIEIYAPSISDWEFDRLNSEIQELPVLRKLHLVQANRDARDTEAYFYPKVG